MAKNSTTAPTERTVMSAEAPALLAITLGKSEVEPASKRTGETAFKSGSSGYHSSGKVIIAGQKYQYNIVVTLVGSKTPE